MAGRLEVITGPMYSGKTEELIRRLRRANIGGANVVAFKPVIDQRYGHSDIKSHNGSVIPCYSVDKPTDIMDLVSDQDVVGIDEGQFFGFWLTDVCEALRDEDRTVIVTGLDQTYRAQAWDHFHVLMALSDRIDKLTSVCHKCGKDAALTQRLIDGKPASFKEDTIVVGGLDTYEARCRECFEVG